MHLHYHRYGDIMKVGDLIYCHPFDRYGVVMGFNYHNSTEDVFDILWSDGVISPVGETFVEVISET